MSYRVSKVCARRRDPTLIEQALTILLYYHLHNGVWIQNSVLSTQAMAICNNGCLYLDSEQLPPGGYPIEPIDKDELHVNLKRLFWVIYILYIQV